MGMKKGKPAPPPNGYKEETHLILNRLRRGTLDPEIARQKLGGKPIEEWDLDELARGRPRDVGGGFRGQKPAWVTPQLEEEAYTRFRKWVKGELSGGSIRALNRIKDLVDDAESDRVRLDAAKFLIEHLVGKPTQEVKGDINMQIQGLLAGVLVNPDGESANPEIGSGDIEEAELVEELDLEDD